MPFVPFAPSSFWRSKLPPLATIAPESASIVERLLSFSNAHSVGYGFNAGVPLLDGTGLPRRTDITCRQGGSGSIFNARLAMGVPWSDSFAPGGGGDQSMVIYDLDTDECWEFNEVKMDPVPSVGWGGWKPRVSIDPWGNYRNLWIGKNKVGVVDWGSRGSGLPLSVGLITKDDVARGYIDHALVLGVREALAGVWSWPAQRSDGRDGNRSGVPEGACLTFSQTVDLTSRGLSPFDYMVARAVQDKGVYVADQTNGGTTFYSEAGVGELVGDEHDASSLPWDELVVVSLDLRKSPDGAAIHL